MDHKIFGEQLLIKHPLKLQGVVSVPPSNTTSVLIQAQISQDKSKDDHQQKSSTRTAEEVLAAIEEKKWDIEYVHTFGSNMRESIMRVLVSKASSIEDCGKKECKGKHAIKTIQVRKLQPRNLRSLLLKTELAQLFEKRRSFKKIFGNESLLLNQLQAQLFDFLGPLQRHHTKE